MDNLKKSLDDYGNAQKNSSLSNYIYETGELIINSQPGSLLGCYLVSALKISKSFNPLAAAATFALHTSMDSTLIKIANKINLHRRLFIFLPSLTDLGMAGLYLGISVLTFKEQLAINAILLACAVFAKMFGKQSKSIKETKTRYIKTVKNLPSAFLLSSLTFGGQLRGLLSSCLLSALKISKNISPLAAAGSNAIYMLTEMTISTRCPSKIVICKTTFNIGRIVSITSKALSILAAVGFYASVSALTFKGQLIVNAIILTTCIAGYGCFRWAPR